MAVPRPKDVLFTRRQRAFLIAAGIADVALCIYVITHKVVSR